MTVSLNEAAQLNPDSQCAGGDKTALPLLGTNYNYNRRRAFLPCLKARGLQPEDFDDQRSDREWEFDDPGETVLRIGSREDAAKLDAIFVTSNVGATVAGQANVRLPTDEDRELQTDGLAVDAKGKVTTTWGSLKQRYK